MVEERPQFILAGNGPYENRGCEAIVRGTTKILRNTFPDPVFVCISNFLSENQYRVQCQKETDDAILHLSTGKLRLKKEDLFENFPKPESLHSIYQYIFRRNALFRGAYRDLIPYLENSSAVLSVGGDNYSLDYGVPALFTSLDDIVLTHKKLLVIWGASVGPFSNNPSYERYISDHLWMVPAIFARESGTVKYLKSIGVSKNVYQVADPAFLMDSTKPPGIEDNLEIQDGAIGINMSPLMARYVTGSDIDVWARKTASIVEKISIMTEMPLYLIAHVTSPHDNDYAFLQNVESIVQKNHTVKETITLVPPYYNAAETKWIISRMAFFIGARTHATIAGFSSNVPTLSLAYSVKARGINQDIFGHTRYCLDPADLNAETITRRVRLMLDDLPGIRRILQERIPAVQRFAFNAGPYLKKIIQET